MPTESLTDEQIAQLLAAASDRRAALLIRLLAIEGFGLREILALDHEQIVRSGRSMSAQLVRHGRPQSIALHVDTCAAIAALGNVRAERPGRCSPQLSRRGPVSG